MDKLVFVSQLVGGFMVLVPFVLRDRYRTGKWFFDKEQGTSLANTRFPHVMFVGLLVLAFGSVIAFLLKALVFGWGIVVLVVVLAFRLAAAAPPPAS